MDSLERFKVTALLIVIIFGLVWLLRLQAGITGAAITGATVLTHVQGANFDVDANAGASLNLVNFPGDSTLTFFRVAGLLDGEGTAKIYLVADDGTKYLIADEDTILASARNLVTGYAVKEDKGNPGGGNAGGGNGGNQGDNGQGNGNNGNQGNNQGQGNSEDKKENKGEERWHHTPKPNPLASFYAAVDEKKEAEKQRQKYNFELTCSDSCELPAGKFASKEVKLLFEVSNARLKINNVQYGFVPYAVAPPEPEEPPVTNTTPPSETNTTLPPEQPPVTNTTNETQTTPTAETQSGGSPQVSFSSGSLTSSSPLAAAVASPGELSPTPFLGPKSSVSPSSEQPGQQQGEGTVTVRQRVGEQPTSLTGAIPTTLEQVDRQSATMLLVDVAIGSMLVWQFVKRVGWRNLKKRLKLR